MKLGIRNKLRQVALRTSLLYAFVGGVWILLSDRVLRAVVHDEHLVQSIELYKGWAFVAVTGVMLYLVLRGQLGRWEREAAARRKAEEALRLSEERFQFALRGSNDGLWDWNLETNTIYYSPRWKSMLGYADNELENIPETWQKLMHPDDFAGSTARLQDLKEGREETFEAEFRMRHKDGRWIYILSRGFPAQRVNEKLVRVVGTHLDLTARKQAEEAVQRSEERHRALVETTFDWIWEMDAEGRYTFASPRIFGLLGYHPEEMLGRTPFDFMSEVEAKRVGAIFAVITAERRPFAALEKEYRHKNGPVVVLESSGVPVFGSNKEFLGYRGSDRDITERKHAERDRQALEAQLRQAQKMEAIGTLAGGVAHDFNNILTVIHGNASLMLSSQVKSLDKTECAQQIVRAAERAAGLTRQLLLFSRKQVMQLSDVNLNEVVGQMTKMLKRILGEDIALQTNYAPKTCLLRGDEGMIEQILLNLVVNSRDAMPAGGQLTIATGTETLTAEEAKSHPDAAPGLHVWLKVTDTGQGISSENMPRIFEPFFTTKEVGKGTGLGLATVYGIVKQHRGWITVKSEVNCGTVAQIYFPAFAPASNPKKVFSAPAALPRGTETILVVEDDPAVRTLILNLLQRCGYAIVQAHSGNAALKLWETQRAAVDLLLTDLVMPEGISGFKLAERLKQDKPSLKVIYMTGYSNELPDKNASLVEGVNFLQKPFPPDALARALRKMLTQPESADQQIP